MTTQRFQYDYEEGMMRPIDDAMWNLPVDPSLDIVIEHEMLRHEVREVIDRAYRTFGRKEAHWLATAAIIANEMEADRG